MNSLRRRIGVERVKEDEPSIQIVAWTNFDRFFGSIAVGDQNNVIRESADLDCPPSDLFNHAGVPLSADRDHIADLKWPIGLQRNSGKEVSERVLQRKTEDDAEDCRGCEESPKINFRKQKSEGIRKENRKRDDREDVANQRRRI